MIIHLPTPHTTDTNQEGQDMSTSPTQDAILAASEAGATHADIMTAHAAGVNVWYYFHARKADATHDDIMAAHTGH